MKKLTFILTIFFSFFISISFSQSDAYQQLKKAYDKVFETSVFDSALVRAKELNFWTLKNEGDTSLRYAVSYRLIGNCFNGMNLMDSAFYYWNRSLDILGKQNRSETVEAADCLNGLGVHSKKKKDYKTAESLLRKSADIYKKLQGEESVAYAYNLKNLGNLYRDKKDFKTAEPFFKQSLEIYKKNIGETDQDYASDMHQLGNFYYDMGNYNSAETYLKNALQIYEKIGGEAQPDYAVTLNDLGSLYSKIEDLKSAKIYFSKSLEIRKITLGEAHPDYAKSLLNVGSFYHKIADYKTALTLYNQSLEIFKKTLGDLHPDYAICLNNIGLLYYDIGDYKTAENYYKKSAEFKLKTLGEEHPGYVSSLNNFGGLYLKTNDFKLAESYYKQALKIRKKILGEDHPDYAKSLNNLGILYRLMGDYKSALPLYNQALEIRKKTLGENNPDYALSLNNLGILYRSMGDYDSAEKFYKQSLEIKKKTLGEDHPDYAMSLNNLGVLYKSSKNYEAAETNFKLAFDIIKRVLGEEHPDYSMNSENFGHLYFEKGDYKSAEPNFIKALDIKKKTIGEEHPNYIKTLQYYAYLLLKTNRETEAFNIIQKNYFKKAKLIADNFEWLNDNQKETYWKNEAWFYDGISTITNACFEKVPEFTELNYNAVLLTKSKLLEAKISSENYYREVDEIREELTYRRRLIAKMESEGSDNKIKLETLRAEADSLDQRLLLSWPEYANQKKNLSITWKKVQDKLENDEAAVEFVRFYNDQDSGYSYNALLIRKSDKSPYLVKLCKEKELTAIQPKSGFSAYYPLIWQPMEKYMEGVKTIYYSPAGEISNIPLHALYPSKNTGDKIQKDHSEKRGTTKDQNQVKVEKDAAFLMDRFKFHQLTSTRYLAMGLKQKENEQCAKSISLFGGVNYDFLPGSTEKPITEKKGKTKDRSSESASGKLAFLEGTVTEVETIGNTLTGKGWQTLLFQFNEASEDKILKLEGKDAKSILHISTHGYAFSDFNFQDSTLNKNSLKYSYRLSQNPMVRSGLILAGGNWAWTGSDTLSKLGLEQNGILTALEVSQLNLRKTKLVVLSACETGLGKIEGSEGTFGLKRGFKLAGVEQIIVSLWSVPDKETMKLMTLFYTDLSLTLNPVISFEKAQKEMRKKYPTEPEKWAGFVLVQ